jgi:hypothetical protein
MTHMCFNIFTDLGEVHTEIGWSIMFCLGRRDMLESPVNMVELTVAQNENGKPLSMPEVGQHNVVVCGMTYVNGVE